MKCVVKMMMLTSHFHQNLVLHLAMKLLVSVPQLVKIVDSSGIWHDTTILAGLVYKVLSIFGITAKPAPLPA